MTIKIKTLLVGASAMALTACGDAPVFNSWNQEAGAFIDEGGFGNATMNNTLIQNGDLTLLANLNQRFQSEVPATITFEFDKATLDDNARAILREQANWIKQFPEISFSVYGHTDLVGSNAYNERLGRRRAQAAVNYLVSQGISRSRLKALVSLGETQPVVNTADRERRNRRTVTEVSGVVRNHPAVLNGKYAQVIFREYVRSAVPDTAVTGSPLGSTGSVGG